jgi:hypothetical protein
MRKDLEGSGRGPILKFYPSIRLEGLSKITKILNKYSLSLGRGLKPRPLEYERRILTT